MDLIDAIRAIDKPHEDDVMARLYTVWGEKLDENNVLKATRYRLQWTVKFLYPFLRNPSFLVLRGVLSLISIFGIKRLSRI